MSTRYTGNTTSSTDLDFKFYKDGILYDAYNVRQVTIHDSLSEAENNIDIIQTIYGYDTQGYADIQFTDYLMLNEIPTIPTEEYSLNLTIDTNPSSDITFNINVTDNWSAILTSINNSLTGAVAIITENKIRITSDLTGASSAIIITDGTSGSGGGFVTAANLALSDTASYPTPINGVNNEIINTSTGIYEYTVDVISIAGTYYDKIFITPENGDAEIYFINNFVLSETEYTGEPSPESSDPNNCILTGILVYGDGSIADGVLISAMSYSDGIISGTNKMMLPYPIQAITDENGEFELELLRNGRYTITIKETGFVQVINVPDSATENLWTLIGVGAISDGTDDIESGEDNW